MATVYDSVAADYPDFLRDESRLPGAADSISFPESEDDIREILARMNADGIPVTVQGARTGIAGGAVPNGGHVLNTSRLNRMTGISATADDPDSIIASVQPGLLLADFREMLESGNMDSSGWTTESTGALEKLKDSGPWFFPPDPTETSASLGGMVASNASGACTFRYGPTRDYVQALRIVLPDGSLLALRRGEQTAKNRLFSLDTDDGRTIAGSLPLYDMPQVKNAAGYFAADDMDMIDLFIGSEGTLGVVSSIELRLVRQPTAVWGVSTFFPSEECALTFVRSVRTSATPPVALEFFDSHVLDLLRKQKAENPAFGELPLLPPEYDTAVYVEYHGDSEDEVTDAVMAMSETMVEAGGNEDATWIANDPREMARLKAFRHAVPEAVNLLIDERRKKEPELTKLGTDMAVPDSELQTVLDMYHSSLADVGLDYVIFGHIGNNHVHVNILPATMKDYATGKQLYMEWAQKIVEIGGTVSAEHGIGKLKTSFLELMYGEEGIAQMQAVKAAFDPMSLLNRGNLFEKGGAA